MAKVLMAAGSQPNYDYELEEKKADRKEFIVLVLIFVINILNGLLLGYLGHDFIKEKIFGNTVVAEDVTPTVVVQSISLNMLADGLDEVDSLEECWFINDKDMSPERVFQIGDYAFMYGGLEDALVYTNNDVKDEYHVSAGYVNLWNTDSYLFIDVFDAVINQEVYAEVLSHGTLVSDGNGDNCYFSEYNADPDNIELIYAYPDSNTFILMSFKNSTMMDYNLLMKRL